MQNKRIGVVEASGTPFERGAFVGRLRAAEIGACLDAWIDSLGLAGIDRPQAYLERFVAETDFLPAIAAYTPLLLDEIAGLAKGADVPHSLLLAAQFMDEEWAYRATQGRTAPRDKCSSIAVRDGAVRIIGQNMDLGGYTDGHEVAYRFAGHAEEPATVLFSISSMIGLMGANAAGLVVCVNSIPQLPAATSGLPVAFIIRGLLARRNVDEAIRFLRTTPHASPQHYLIADLHGARSIEIGPRGEADLTDSWAPDAIAHTNHPLASTWVLTEPQVENSVVRLASLTRRMRAGPFNLAWAQSALSSTDDTEHPVSRSAAPGARASALTGMISFTTGSMLTVLDLESPTIECWLTAGPPSLQSYSRLTIDRESDTTR